MDIIRIGCNGTHDANFSVARPDGYPSNSAIIYNKNSAHYYQAYKGNYINDWVH